MNSVVIGRRGLGKSTLAEWLANKGNGNKIVFDPNNQFKDATQRTSDIEELKDWMEATESDDDENFYICFVPTGEVEPAWDLFAPVIWQYGDYALIIDECHWLMKPNYLNPWLSRFIRQAPRRERGDENPIDIIMTAHRPQDINGTVLGQTDYALLFRQTKSRDLEYIAKEFDFDSEAILCDNCQSNLLIVHEDKKIGRLPIVEVVRQLRTPQTEGDPGRDVIVVPVESPDEYTVMRDPKEWYVNIRVAPKGVYAPQEF